MPSPVFSPSEAVELGQFVLAAYNQYAQGDPPGFVPPNNYTLAAKLYAEDITDVTPSYKVFGFIARSGTDVIVAIRGTEDVFEWLKDFEFLQVAFPYVNAGQTEKGFTQFYSTLCTAPASTAPRAVEALRAVVADGSVKTVRIAGHSLGGALATMLAIDSAANIGGFSNNAVGLEICTFGSPAVGDKVFAGTFDNLVSESWRVANLPDIVPQVPPVWAGYTHVDAQVPINSADNTKHTFECWHALETYLNTLDPTVPLTSDCTPG
jgi:predicted lipase